MPRKIINKNALSVFFIVGILEPDPGSYKK